MLGNPGLFRWERDGPSGLPGGLGARIAPGKVHCYLLRIALVGRGFSGGQGGRKRHGLFGERGTDGHEAGIPLWSPGTTEELGVWMGSEGKGALNLENSLKFTLWLKSPVDPDGPLAHHCIALIQGTGHVSLPGLTHCRHYNFFL